MRTLLIEDDLHTAQHVCRGLHARGHAVEVARDGRTGLLRAADEAFDVAVIDRMLPELDGIAILKALRSSGVLTPVILLTALGGVSDRVQGLHAGADDYLVKPFDLDELDARMQALNRRAPRPAATIVDHGAFRLDRLRRRATAGDEELALTVSEFAMLEVLMINAGRPVTKSMLLEQVFDLDGGGPAAVVEPHVSRLRAKIAQAGVPDPIRTLRGRGYSFHAD